MIWSTIHQVELYEYMSFVRFKNIFSHVFKKFHRFKMIKDFPLWIFKGVRYFLSFNYYTLYQIHLLGMCPDFVELFRKTLHLEIKYDFYMIFLMLKKKNYKNLNKYTPIPIHFQVYFCCYRANEWMNI